MLGVGWGVEEGFEVREDVVEGGFACSADVCVVRDCALWVRFEDEGFVCHVVVDVGDDVVFVVEGDVCFVWGFR